MSLQAYNHILPLPPPIDVPHECQVSWMQYSAASQGGMDTFPPTISGILKLETCPLFLIDRQGVCMQVHAVGDGAMSEPHLPSALLLP